MTIRMVDANANRAVEGVRVLEDVARFIANDATLAEALKSLRHSLRHGLAACIPQMVAERDIIGDVGTRISTSTEASRPQLTDLIRANAARAQEALRVIEEWCKREHAVLAVSCESWRYRMYDLEKQLLAALPAHLFAQQRLYALVDTSLTKDPLPVAAQLVRGGAGIVQLRAKQLGPKAYLELAGRMQDVVREAGGLFVVNDHVAIAKILAADGIHVGQDDLPAPAVRQVVGDLMAIGVSCHSLEDLQAAQAAGVDYVGIGPMYATGTKPHEPVRGPSLLEQVREHLTVPSYLIGGLTTDRIAALDVPHGVALAGALCTADDPSAAARAACAALKADHD